MNMLSLIEAETALNNSAAAALREAFEAYRVSMAQHDYDADEDLSDLYERGAL